MSLSYIWSMKWVSWTTNLGQWPIQQAMGINLVHFVKAYVKCNDSIWGDAISLFSWHLGCSFVFTFALGAGPVPGLLLPEIFPSRIRAKAMSFCMSVHWVNSLSSHSCSMFLLWHHLKVEDNTGLLTGDSSGYKFLRWLAVPAIAGKTRGTTSVLDVYYFLHDGCGFCEEKCGGN